MAFVVLCVYLQCLIETTEAGFTREARDLEAGAIDPHSATHNVETNANYQQFTQVEHLCVSNKVVFKFVF